MTRKLIHVAAAVIENNEGAIFLAKRPDDKHQGGLWEFPGGKVEVGESAAEALKRELQEEVGIVITKAVPLISVPYHYPDKSVLLDVFHVTGFTGEAWGAEGQLAAWVDKADLDSYDFPAANQPILNAVLLPDLVLITPPCKSIGECLAGIKRSVEQYGVSAVILRQPQLNDTDLANWFLTIQADALFKDIRCDGKGSPLLIINSSVELANQVGADGVHLNSHRLSEIDSRSTFAGRWLGGSCHDAQELAVAAEVGCDYVTLSPIQQTATHPNANLLGWEKAAALIGESGLPIYVLGGLSQLDVPQAKQLSAQGIAAISALWTG